MLYLKYKDKTTLTIFKKKTEIKRIEIKRISTINDAANPIEEVIKLLRKKIILLDGGSLKVIFSRDASDQLCYSLEDLIISERGFRLLSKVVMGDKPGKTD
jgi:hypothetical protein